MNLMQFVITFLTLMLVASIVIVGWYAITRGRIEYYPDGKAFKTGKIFKAWHFFWNQTEVPEPSVMCGVPFRQAVANIQRELKIGLNVDAVHGVVEVPEMVRTYLWERILLVEEVTKAKVHQYEEDKSKFILIKSSPVYKFSEFVRDPLSECPTCMASVYGTIIYWIVQWFSDGVMFNWTLLTVEHDVVKVVVSFLFWPIFCVGVAFINTILAKKL